VSFVVPILGVIFALLSSVILAYVSMATGVGPWIAPTIVLVSSVLLKIGKGKNANGKLSEKLVLIQSVGSVGGIVAVGIGFTLPMLYFLDKNIFNSWIANPAKFSVMIAAICLAAGGLGIYLARLFGEKLIIKEKLNFPVSHLIYKMIATQGRGGQVRNMFTGFFSTAFFCFLRDGLFKFKGIFPKAINLFTLLGDKFSIALYLGPTLWAVGFITGAVITIPLIAGMISKYLIMYPLNQHAKFLPFKLFDPLDPMMFTMAFVAGMVVSGFIFSSFKYPQIIWKSIKVFLNNNKANSKDKICETDKDAPHVAEVQVEKKTFLEKLKCNAWLKIEAVFVVIGVVSLLSYFKFGPMTQLFMLTLTIIATYQISWMGGKIGMIPFGRFATFIMVPTLLIFRLDYIQLTLLCVFFNVCSATASDLLFDYKVGDLCNVSWNKIHRYQWLGLLATSAGMGIFLWLLFTNFQIGSTQLFAYRALSRSLLIKSLSFNLWVVGMGAVFGWLLKKIKINPTLTLCGILMPNALSIGLIIGGLGSLFVKKVLKQDPDKYSTFWSGVFASESLWILVGILLKLIKG
jgi:hypothetical protein